MPVFNSTVRCVTLRLSSLGAEQKLVACSSAPLLLVAAPWPNNGTLESVDPPDKYKHLRACYLLPRGPLCFAAPQTRVPLDFAVTTE